MLENTVVNKEKFFALFKTGKGKFCLYWDLGVDMASFITKKVVLMELIAPVSDLTEEQAACVVDVKRISFGRIDYPDFKNPLYSKSSAISSFASLLDSLGIAETENLYLFKIIK